MSGLLGTRKFIRLDSVLTPNPSRLVFTFTSNLPFFKKKEFFVEYSEPIADFTEATANVVFAAVMAPMAQASGASLSISCLDEAFAQSLDKLGVHWSKVYGWKPLQLIAKQLKSGRAVTGCGMLFSGGIDSMASFLENKKRAPRLFVIFGADVPASKTTFIKALKADFYEPFAKQEKTSITFISTDVRAAMDEKSLSKRFKVGWYAEVLYGLFLTSLVAPIAALKKLIVASCSLEHPDGECGGDPAILDQITFAGTRMELSLLDTQRVEKIKKYLLPNPHIQKYIRVCWEQFEKLNCSRCNKCLRTLCELLVNNIDPNHLNFEMTDRTLSELRSRMTGSFYHFFYNANELVFFRQIQSALALNEIQDIRGSKDFFKWFQDFQELRRERPGYYKKARYLAESLRQKFVSETTP